MKILVIDDDKVTLGILSKYLSNSKYNVLTAENGRVGLDLLNRNNDISLIIVDVLMPEVNGIEFCREVRADNKFKKLPIMILTSQSSIDDKYIGFEAGADDYIIKPFESLEVLLRIQALLRRSIEENSEEESILKVNNNKFSININGQDIYLTSIEFDILNYLYRNKNKPVSNDELLEKVMDYPPKVGNPEIIRTHIKNIRHKLEDNPSNPSFITTVPKRGYMLKV